MEPDDTKIENLREIDGICETFQQAWVGGAQPKIEDYTRNARPDTVANLWQELMLIELQRLRASGKAPTEEAYRLRYPQHAHLIQSRWFQETSDVEPVLCAGQKVDRFTLRREIGRGGSGVVWLASDEELQRDVAVKFLLAANGVAGKHGSALYEARVAAVLNHARIVAVYEKGSYQQWDYIVSRYIEGQPLQKWRPRSLKLDFTTVARMCIEIAEAVHYAHERGVIHRDLKPGNVIVDNEGHPYITDFGLAKRSDSGLDGTISGQLMGTHGYMSPEQAMGRSNKADRRSDIYSIGAMMYELLTGSKPFCGDFFEVIQATVNKKPTRPRRVDSSIPQALEDICLKCLRKKPGLRYATAKELADDLRNFLDDGQRQTRTRQTLESARDRLYVHRRQAVVLAAASVAAVLWQTDPWGKLISPTSNPQLPLRVKLSADPPESELAVVRIDPTTGLLLPESLRHTPNAAEYELELVPGDYFITARYGQRFHEVYRHVPAPGEATSNYVLPAWRTLRDRRGTFVELREILLPDETVTEGMVLISHLPKHAAPSPIRSALKDAGPPRPFFVDPTEFTQADYKRVSLGKLPSDSQFNDRGDEYPICVRFDLAVNAAERAGKRLPTELEFEYMATDGYTRAFPWGNTVPEEGKAELSFGVAGAPAFDVVQFEGKPVSGLASNVAEWTTSLPRYGPGPGEIAQGEWQDHFARVVRGGALNVVMGNPKVSSELRNPLIRTFVNALSWKVGLGFRCVRSSQPRWQKADFA